MNLSGNTVLITGGTAGIGFAFAERFVKAGSTVIVCGRSEKKLGEAKRTFPDIITRVCDVSNTEDRKSLYEWVTTHYPEVNALVNNAGILRRFDILEANAVEEWDYFGKEIAVNLEGAMHLAMMFAPYISRKERGFLINITSGLAFAPDPSASIYAATKAAIHSFSMSLRFQLSETPVQVIEVAPPLVNTDGLLTEAVPVDEFADSVFADLENGELEIGYNNTEKSFRLSRDEIDETVQGIFNQKNKKSFGD